MFTTQHMRKKKDQRIFKKTASNLETLRITTSFKMIHNDPSLVSIIERESQYLHTVVESDSIPTYTG